MLPITGGGTDKFTHVYDIVHIRVVPFYGELSHQFSDDLRELIILSRDQQSAFVMKIDVGQIVLDFFHRFFVTNFPCVLMLLKKLLHLAERNTILPFSDYRLDSYFFLFC